MEEISDPEGESAAALASIVAHLRLGEGAGFVPTDFDFVATVDPLQPVVLEARGVSVLCIEDIWEVGGGQEWG